MLTKLIIILQSVSQVIILYLKNLFHRLFNNLRKYCPLKTVYQTEEIQLILVTDGSYTLHKSTKNTKFVNIKPLFWGNFRVRFLPTSVTFSSTNQYVTLCHVCFCSRMSYLIYTVEPLTPNSRLAAL